MPSPSPPPALMEEIVEEILLRVPPDDPARLMRAALACKGWFRLLSGPGFRQRHGTLPMLRVILSFTEEDGEDVVRFVPACSFRPPHADRRGWQAVDSRHGRVLHNSPWNFRYSDVLSVWDPITDELRQLPALPHIPSLYRFKAAVLCASSGSCDHLDCHHGPFLVVFMGAYLGKMFAYICSSEADAWSKPTYSWHSSFFSEWMRTAHVGNALYFMLEAPTSILSYDLGTQEMTDSPTTYVK